MKTLTRSKSDVLAKPRLSTSLKISGNNVRRRRGDLRKRFASIGVFALVLVVLFGVTLVQAQLVSPQQEIDRLSEELGELRAERSVLEHEVAIASAPGRILSLIHI